MEHATRMARFAAADLYVVITEAFCGGRSALDVLDGVLNAGVTLVQCREKDLTDKAYVEHAQAFCEKTEEAGALLIIDDRVDIALAVEADGVHLGRQDLPVAKARTVAPDLVIGASSHSLEHAMEAQEAGASYVNIGPIFGTQTKTGTADPVTPAMISRVAPHLRIPFTTMGGIKAHNIDEVLRQGVRHAAVVTAVTEAPDVTAAAKELRQKIRAYR